MEVMPITRDEVAHLARLSRLALSDEELDHLAPQLDQIISAVAQGQEVAADGIPPTPPPTRARPGQGVPRRRADSLPDAGAGAVRRARGRTSAVQGPADPGRG